MYITKIYNYNQSVFPDKLKFNRLKDENDLTNSIVNKKELPKYNPFLFNSYNINFNGLNKVKEFEIIDLYKSINPNITPDRYQIDAARAIMNNDSVIVTAPTGTGKTLIAEAAIYNNLNNGKKTIYTTPLKALTNQKYFDFKKEFAEDNVGIMTGDTKENPNAPILLMTTEIYRNILKNNDAIDVQKELDGIQTVIFDEFHYMNDLDRGIIWEESIMNSPENIQLISLSATVKNADIIRNWMQSLTKTKGVKLINVPSRERYVPLQFYRYDEMEAPVLVKYEDSLIDINYLLSNEDISHRAQDVLVELESISSDKSKNGLESLEGIFANKGLLTMEPETLAINLRKNLRISQNDALRIALILSQTMPQPIVKEPVIQHKKGVNFFPKKPMMAELVSKINIVLDDINPNNPYSSFAGFPAITFLFSRKGCEVAADKYFQHVQKKRNLKNKSELENRKKQIERIIDEKIAEGKILGIGFDKNAKQRLLSGIGVHHAGMLPAHKALVEELFQKKLLDVVFATETLAAGINMPAKTTIITSLEKPGRNRSYQPLTVNEFQQMAGRAGRRGIDKVGNVIIIPSNDFDVEKGEYLSRSMPNPVKSKFNINTSDVIEILQGNRGHLDINKINSFIGNSFAVYSAKIPSVVKKEMENNFFILLNILKTKNFISQQSSNRFKINKKAQMLAELKGINEIYLADLIADGVLATMSPAVLAAVVASLTNEGLPMEDKKTIQSLIRKLPRDLSQSLIDLVQPAFSLNSLINSQASQKIMPVSMDVNLAQYTYDFVLSDEMDYEKRWNNILLDMKANGDLYFEGNFFHSLNTTVDVLNQIHNVSLKMREMEDDDDKKFMYQVLADNAKAAVKILKVPPLGETL